ncbi:alpha/beta hydrolase [Sphingomonas pruni]|uniref:alpha/beta hydrolase n=1 Tax=Sphingomonas pruni TaxID=40683 RepID=UPI00082FA8E7|nr:alpha/beta hydrolase [Sphingomonas pruni]
MSDNARLAAGLAEYLNAVRGAPGTPLETARLLADRNAHRIAYPLPTGMTVANSFVVRAGDEVPVRIYRPAGKGALPAIVYFHGGGFTTGSIETYQPLAMALAEATGAVVISVHYARLPEATPRATVEQCYDALAWTARMASALAIDPARIAIAGDSAGAFLAAQVAILARDRGGPTPVCQLLAYGMFDVDGGRAGYAAVRDPVLTLPVIRAIIAAYRSADARDPALFEVPLRSDLGGLPPAILLEAEHDALVDEGREFAERLRVAGVHCEFRIAPEMCHGFLRAVRFSAPARAEMRWLGGAFRTLTQPRN